MFLERYAQRIQIIIESSLLFHCCVGWFEKDSLRCFVEPHLKTLTIECFDLVRKRFIRFFKTSSLRTNTGLAFKVSSLENEKSKKSIITKMEWQKSWPLVIFIRRQARRSISTQPPASTDVTLLLYEVRKQTALTASPRGLIICLDWREELSACWRCDVCTIDLVRECDEMICVWNVCVSDLVHCRLKFGPGWYLRARKIP